MVKLPGSDENELLRENWRVQTGESKNLVIFVLQQNCKKDFFQFPKSDVMQYSTIYLTLFLLTT